MLATELRVALEIGGGAGGGIGGRGSGCTGTVLAFVDIGDSPLVDIGDDEDLILGSGEE